MNLSEAQKHAMLELGGSAEGHGFVPQRVLNDLLAYGLIHWRNEAEIDFTAAGQLVYEELAGAAEQNVESRAHP